LLSAPHRSSRLPKKTALKIMSAPTSNNSLNS
jgi:hypothetical protein